MWRPTSERNGERDDPKRDPVPRREEPNKLQAGGEERRGFPLGRNPGNLGITEPRVGESQGEEREVRENHQRLRDSLAVFHGGECIKKGSKGGEGGRGSEGSRGSGGGNLAICVCSSGRTPRRCPALPTLELLRRASDVARVYSMTALPTIAALSCSLIKYPSWRVYSELIGLFNLEPPFKMSHYLSLSTIDFRF